MAQREDMPSYIMTYSGILVDPLDLQPEHVRIEDIAHHLAMQCRWSGAVRWNYSVAQHAWHASYLVPPEFAYDALHHDDAEAYLQDMARPLKNHITLGAAYREAEEKIERVIGKALGVRFGLPEVKQADVEILCAEAEQLVHGRGHWTYFHEIATADVTIPVWSNYKAKAKWLIRHEELKGDRL